MIRRIVFSLLLTLCCTYAWSRAQYTKSDSLRVVSLLSEAAKLPKSTNWMLHFARKFYGIPYVAHTLDRNRRERLVVNLKELDCTTYVEQVLALSVCAAERKRTFGDFCNMLMQIRYMDGKIGYANRLHYFTTWIDDNVKKGLVTDIGVSRAPFTAVQRLNINYMSKNVSKYSMLKANPKLLPYIKAMEKKLTGRKERYIPKSEIYNSELLRRTIADGDILVIITNRKGLDTSHIGIAVWHKDGLHMINASSVHGKVVKEPMTLREYMKKHPSQIGIRVCRMKRA